MRRPPAVPAHTHIKQSCALVGVVPRAPRTGRFQRVRDEYGRPVDECLYAGSAPYYAVGRMPYPQQLADALREHLELGGQGRLLDVGCGPGSLMR